MNSNITCITNALNFLELASNILYAREAEYSLLLGLSELQAKAEKPSTDCQFFCLYHFQKLIGAALLNDRRLVVTQISNSYIPFFIDYLIESQISIPGVVGPNETSEEFARQWSKIAKKEMTLAMGQKIYQLEKVTKPKNVVGKITNATEIDLSLVSEWLYDFTTESIPHQPTTLEKMTVLANAKILKNEVYLWKDQNDQTVSMNLVGRPTKNGISISGVFTPKKWRGYGFASAVVAYSSQAMLGAGKRFCVLYTDIANPTSNKIYQRLGYQEVASSADFIFK